MRCASPPSLYTYVCIHMICVHVYVVCIVAATAHKRTRTRGTGLASRYEAGPSPLQLAWSDAGCSDRFYDYGSTRMAEVVAAEPDKAARWRTSELDAAWSYAELVARLEHGMEDEGLEHGMEDEGVPAGGTVLDSTAPSGAVVDEDEVME